MWVKLDDQFPDHPKFAQLSPIFRIVAQHLHINTICWCIRHLTDGVVPRGMVNRLGSDIIVLSEHLAHTPIMLHQVVGELLAAGVWDETETGDYSVHDYLKYQFSRAQVLAKQAAALARKRDRANGSRELRANFARSSLAPDPDPKDQDQDQDPRASARVSPDQNDKTRKRTPPPWRGGAKGAVTCPHQPPCRTLTACVNRALADGRAARGKGKGDA